MNKVAFVVPVHPNHYRHALRFFRTAKENNIEADFYFILGWQHEVDTFERMRISDDYKILCIPRELNDRPGVITLKKWWGLEQIIDKYEYVLCIDSEHIIIKHVDIYKICEEFYDERVVIGSDLDYNVDSTCRNINLTCSDLFCVEDQFLLRQITEEFVVYFWNNHLPIYRTDIAKEFLEKIGPRVIDLSHVISWEHFDYNIFLYYLILGHQFGLINLNDHFLNEKFTSSYNERLSDMKLETAHSILDFAKPYMIPMSFNGDDCETTRGLEKYCDSVFMIYDVRPGYYEYK